MGSSEMTGITLEVVNSVKVKLTMFGFDKMTYITREQFMIGEKQFLAGDILVPIEVEFCEICPRLIFEYKKTGDDGVPVYELNKKQQKDIIGVICKDER
jgi:hypothetical protein